MAAPSSPWDTARLSARAARVALAGDTPEISASSLIERGLVAAGLRLGLLPPGDPLLSGAHAVLDPEFGSVWVRADAPVGLRAVYIAHELAHFHLHENGDPCRCVEADFVDMDGLAAVGYGPRQRREAEANVWAREFLLPTPLAARLFAPEGTQAREIAERLELPLAVVLGQLTEGLTTPIAPLPNVPTPEVAADLPPVRPSPARVGNVPFPLDPSQAAAAYAERGPLLVGAGPGTGKTRTLTARVLYLTRERGVRPENLLALTFSRKAAEEMRERISAEAPDVGRRAAISTFHAYGFDLLRRHGGPAGLPPNPVLLDAVDACALLERRVGSLKLTALRYLHDPAFPLPDILRMIGRAKEDLIDPLAFERRARESGDEKLLDVARVYPVYEALLREKGALDFADLICRALRLLREDEGVRRAEQAQWRHVLVDEYQDVNRAGALLVGVLAARDDGAGLWAVGDLRQAIYRFRGASPANVTRFQSDFPNGQRTDLKVNYRSQPELVRLFGRVSTAAACYSGAVASSTGNGAATWEASRPASVDGPATLAVADDDIAQADGIAARMHGFFESGIAFSDQVALCRTRGQARALRAALFERGVPVATGPEENNLLAKRDVRDLLSLLSRIVEPGGPGRHRFATLPEGIAGARARGGDAYDIWAEALWGVFGMARRLEDPAAVAALLSVARGFRDRAPVLLDPGEDSARAFLDHVRRVLRLGGSLGSVAANDPGDAVRVLTVHASKGLEFPVVFVPNLSAGKFPTRPMPSLLPPLPEDSERTINPVEDFAESEVAEEERLFFVALTRARDYLILSRAQRYGRMSARPSPLLSGIADAPEVGGDVWSRRDSLASFADDSFSPDDLSPKYSDSDPIQISSGDADLYLRCPRRYFYRRVLNLPEGERTAYARFKRAVSEALESADPPGALRAAWETHGPDPTHPYDAVYRHAAEEIVGRADTPGPRPKVVALALSLEHGTITVQADARVGAALECRTFRKSPPDAEVPADRRLSLLQAASEGSGEAGTVQMRYLQTGQTFPVADKPKIRAKHLMEYEGALRGIHAEIFGPDPADSSDCPTCPYLFICPD